MTGRHIEITESGGGGGGEAMTGQLLVLQVLESVVPVTTESFNCRSGPVGGFS